MKLGRSAVAVGLMVWCAGVFAGSTALPLVFTITINENCVGTFATPPGAPFPASGTLPCVMTPDTAPPPVGLAPTPVMTYSLTNTGASTVQAGELVLNEPGGGFSDIIRFGGFGLGAPGAAGPAVGPTLTFYSDNSNGVDAPADTGLPSSFIIPFFQVPESGGEGNNGFTWTPPPGLPGFITGSTVTYVIHSDTPTAPEPATLALLGIGLAGLGFSRRQKQ